MLVHILDTVNHKVLIRCPIYFVVYVAWSNFTNQTSGIGYNKEYTVDSSLLGCGALFLGE
jgi:hypothetical protein